MTVARSAYRATCVIAVGLILLLAATRIWLIQAPFSTDANEGWNAFQSLRALGVAGAGSLYPPPGSLTGNNYPPLSFYLIGWMAQLFGNTIVVGRVVAGLAVLIVAVEIRAIVVRLTGDRRAAALAALFFLGFVVSIFRTYLFLYDPQWLAHAVMTAGLVLLIPRDATAEPAPGAVIAAALLMVLGGTIKHNIFAFPVAVTAWLATHHRRAFTLWVVTGLVAVLVFALGAYLLYGTDFFADLLSAPRRQTFGRLVTKSLPIVAAFLPGLILSLRLTRSRFIDSRIDLILFALPIAMLLGIFLRTGLGVDRNVHFEALIALSIAIGTVLARDDNRVTRGLALLAFVALVPIGLAASVKDVRSRAANEANWAAMRARIATIPGPVACEALALCYDAGKAFEMDFFLYGERMADGRGDAALRKAIADRHFAAIVREAPPPPAKREAPNPIWTIVEPSFSTAYTAPDGRRLLVPRP